MRPTAWLADLAETVLADADLVTGTGAAILVDRAFDLDDDE